MEYLYHVSIYQVSIRKIFNNMENVYWIILSEKQNKIAIAFDLNYVKIYLTSFFFKKTC